jgi:undecaprenyl diphosphate synthase
MENAARPLQSAGPATSAGTPPYGVRHVAIIMDGNGRWAQKRGMPRSVGHHAGVEALRRICRHAADVGIPYMTIYSFSSENWSRPASEIADLMGLLKRFIRNDLADLHARNVRVRVIGERASLQPDIRALLDEAERTTAQNTALNLIVAFNYGARQEIVDAARALAEEARAGRLDPAAISADMIAARLSTAGIPDPDLIIRTSGEQRLSNFLLWQAAYAEFVFTPVLWPDFDAKAFDDALREYAGRTRRFGGL